MERYLREPSWKVLLREILLTILVVMVVIGLIYLINKLLNGLSSKLLSSVSRFEKGIRIKNYELLDPERQLRAAKILIRIIRYAVILLIVYLAFPVLFGIFPFTRDLSENLLSYILSPFKKIGTSIWNHIPNLMTIMVLLVVFRYVIRLFRFLKTEIGRGEADHTRFYKDWANPTLPDCPRADLGVYAYCNLSISARIGFRDI